MQVHHPWDNRLGFLLAHHQPEEILTTVEMMQGMTQVVGMDDEEIFHSTKVMVYRTCRHLIVATTDTHQVVRRLETIMAAWADHHNHLVHQDHPDLPIRLDLQA